MPESHGTIRVLITSIDGRITHPFRLTQTVDDVRQFGYQKLVQDKAQVPLSSTWVEFGGQRQPNDTVLSTFVQPEAERKKEREDDPDLTLTLAWTQQGGKG